MRKRVCVVLLMSLVLAIGGCGTKDDKVEATGDSAIASEDTEGTEASGSDASQYARDAEVVENQTPELKASEFMVTDTSDIVRTTTRVNVRTGPDTSYDILTTLGYGTEVSRTGILDNGWSRVEIDGNTYYMHSDYLTTEELKPVEVQFSVTDVDETVWATTSVNVRTGPATSYQKVTTLGYGQEAHRTGVTDNGWSRVNIDGTDYYVNSSYLTAEKIEPVQTVAGSADLSGMVFDGNVSSACQSTAINLYSLVPQNVKNAIINQGYQVIVSSNPWWTDGHAGTYYPIEGSFSQGRAIAIYAGSVGKVNMAVIHEIGHFVDNYIGRRDGYGYTTFGYQGVSSSSEWHEICAAEAGVSGFPSWATDCVEDYFAECCWKALANPGWCASTLPRSYEFVMRYINAC